jgi:hypothetical protein
LTGEHLNNFGTYAGNSCRLLAETTAELGRVTHTLSITAQGAIYDSVMDHVLTPMIDSFENPTLAKAFSQIRYGVETCGKLINPMNFYKKKRSTRRKLKNH